jgi:hypothetical protein
LAPLAVGIEQIVDEYSDAIDSTAAAGGFGLGARLDKPRMDIYSANKVATTNVGITVVHSQIDQEGLFVYEIRT